MSHDRPRTQTFAVDGDVTPFTALPQGRAPAHVTQRALRVPTPPPAVPDVPAALEAAPAGKARRRSGGYGAWLLGGTLVGAALGLLSVRGAAPQAVAPIRIGALTPALPHAPARTDSAPQAPVGSAPQAPVGSAPQAPVGSAPQAPVLPPEAPQAAPPVTSKPPGVVQVQRSGEPAVLNALRSVEKDAFDRVVFEFRERMPGYRIAYVEKPVRDCGSGEARRIDGNARLEVRFFPAAAHTESGEPSIREREIKPALSMVRELERTCDFEGVVTWVVGTAAARHYRAFELSAPPRLVVDIDR